MNVTRTWWRRLFLCASVVAPVAPLSAVSLSANFNALQPYTNIAGSYTEGGLQFASTTVFNVTSGGASGIMFGWNWSDPVDGNALVVHNNGWVGISAGGAAIDSISFFLGFDWDGYAIEYGLMDTTFSYQAYRSGVMVDSADYTSYSRQGGMNHGGNTMTLNPVPAFDTILIRSTAVAYRADPGSGLPGDWMYSRGPVVGYGDANHIAFDDVVVRLATAAAASSVPDHVSTFMLFAGALCVAAALRRHHAAKA